MSKFYLGDEYHQTLKPFKKEVNDFLKGIKNPKKYIENLIKEDMKGKGITVSEKESKDSDIINFIKENNIITTTIALKEGFIKQSLQLQQAITRITAAGMDIGCIADKKPYVYFYGITRGEARKRTKKDTQWSKGPRVSYGNTGGY